jgi:lysozyme
MTISFARGFVRRACVVAAVAAAACGRTSPEPSPAPTAGQATASQPVTGGSGATVELTLLEGIDASHVQQAIDWPTVAGAGKTFAFIKATQGTTEVDPRFSANWPAAKAAGLLRGAYHFYQPGDDPAAQANHFLRTVMTEVGDLPPVLDIETASESASGSVEASTQLMQDVQRWLATVDAATGVSSIVYTSRGFFDSLGTAPAAVTRRPLWIAEYGVSSPRPVTGWSTWTFWQYSSTGTTTGIPVQVDFSKFSGDRGALAALTRQR